MEGSFAPSDLIIRGESIGLRVLEAAAGGDGIFNPDGTVNIVIQRPGAGRGPGDRIFTAEHLKADCDAGVFNGWPMFDNHDSPLARKARASLPRPPSELAGVVRESYFDPDYEDPELDAKRGFEKGAACARVAVSDPMEALIRKLPEAIKVSVNGLAKNLKRGNFKGKPGWVVEGYVNDPEDSSIDFVTAAGAGGDVRRVLEACQTGGGDPPNDDEEDEVNLQEALESEEFGRVLEARVDAIIDAKGLISEEEADRRVQEAVAAQTRVRDLRDHARTRIEEAKGLGAAARTDLLERFGARDTGNGVLEAAPALAVVPVLEGDVEKKTRLQVLDEALDAAFKSERDRVQEAAPTRVRGQGSQGGSGDGGQGGADAPVHAPDSSWVVAAQRAGVDVDKAYGVKTPAAS